VFTHWLKDGAEDEACQLELIDPPSKLLFTKTKLDNSDLSIITCITPTRIPAHPVQANPFPALNDPKFDRSSPSQRAYISNYIRKHDYIEPPPSAFPAMDVLDCKRLMEETNWDVTKIGPRSAWPGSIETLVQVVLSSPTQDALWLGEDFQMV
jgi:hypothetical protein